MSQRCSARLVILALCAMSMLGGCTYTGCCDWECDDPVFAGVPVLRPVAILGDTQERGKIESFRIDAYNTIDITNRGTLSDEAIRELLASQPKQTVIETRMLNVATGYMDQLGIDPFAKGFSITTNYADGSSNEQVFDPQSINADNWTLDLLRYSHRNGEWSGMSMQSPPEQTPAEPPAAPPSAVTTRQVPFLPPGVILNPPRNNQLIILVTPTLIDESASAPSSSGSTGAPTTDAAAGIPQPRTNIFSPGPSSPRTMVATPGKVVFTGFSRSDMNGEPIYSPNIVIDLFGGYTGVNVPTVGTGTHIVGADENFLVTSPDWLDGFNVGGRLQVPLSMLWKRGDGESASNRRSPYLFLGGRYTEAEGDSSVVVEPGGDTTAITLINLDSPGGFTGIGFGATGAEGTMDVEFEEWDIELGGGFKVPLGCCGTKLNLEPHLAIAGSELLYEGEVRNATFPDNFGRLQQEIDTTRLELAIRAAIRHRISKTFSLHGAVTLGGYYYDADGSAVQSIDFPLLAPPDDLFDVRIDDSKDGIGFAAGAELGVEWRITSNMRLKVFGGVEWESDQAYWKNPANPALPIAELDTEDQWRAELGVNLQFRF